jgi:hypothetical protein
MKEFSTWCLALRLSVISRLSKSQRVAGVLCRHHSDRDIRCLSRIRDQVPGNDPKGIQNILLSLMIGLINGYLFAGSLWFYMDGTSNRCKRWGCSLANTRRCAENAQGAAADLLNPFCRSCRVYDHIVGDQ